MSSRFSSTSASPAAPDARQRFNLCLIGQGISASPSAVMQEAALHASGRQGSYQLVDVAPEGLPAVLRDLRSGRWHGANVTTPYKYALAAACDELEGDAAAVGAVNTITVTADGRLIGDNTDTTGFEMGLSAHRLWPLPQSRALVVGAGGVAAAVVLALTRVPVARITVVARQINSARALVERVGESVDCDLAVALWDEDFLERLLATADIIVNATSAGLADMPFTPARLQTSCTVADVRYRPRPVDLVEAAALAGLRSCDGVEMLLHQGMLSFHRWTGDEPPYHAARLALNEALAGVNAVAVIIATPIGALAGLGAGWLSLFLERIEGLEAEEREDRDIYERDVALAQRKATEAGEKVPVAEAWVAEGYGWTWIERVLCPLLGAMGFAAFAAHGAVDSGLFIHLFWLTVFVQIVGFDLKHRLILNRITYPAVVVALGLSFVSPGLTIWSSLAGGAAVGLFFVIQNLVSRGSIGLGDAKLGALVGAICGISLDYNHIGAVYAVIYAIFLGGGVALLLLILRLRSLKDPIPYGPFLCAGAAIILFQGP